MMSLRQHSNQSGDDKNANNNYQKNFEQMLNQQSFSEQEKQIREQELKLKQEELAKEKARVDEAKKQYEQAKAQDFEDLLSGKKQEQAEKGFQEMFKDYYAKVKELKKDDLLNSAQSSINSFSSILEKRRAIFSKIKQETDQEKKEEQKMTQEQQSQDKSTEAKMNQEQTQENQQQQQTQEQQQQQQQNQQSQEETTNEQKRVWHSQFRSNFSSKANQMSEKFCMQYPKTAKCFTYMKEVWCETFPDDQGNVRRKIQQRKEVAKQQKEFELSSEQIEKLQQEIPDWKRQAIVVTDQPIQEEKKGIFKRIASTVSSKISKTEAAQNFYQSEEYAKIEKMRAEMSEFKNNLKEEMDSSQNPFVQRSRNLADLVLIESEVALAVKEMKKYDPSFDLIDLHYETEEVFKEFFCNYLSGNIKFIEKICGKAALAVVKSELKRREIEQWKYKYTDILSLAHPNFTGGCVPDKCPPQFTFTIEVQEIEAKEYLTKDGKRPKIQKPQQSAEQQESQENKLNAFQQQSTDDSGEEKILDSTYRITLARHENPEIELTGHYWEIVEFNKVGELQKLV